MDVQFTDTSSGIVLSWFWDFGDGNTSTLQNPLHTYAQDIAYTATLTVYGSFGNSSHVSHTVDLTDRVTDIVLVFV